MCVCARLSVWVVPWPALCSVQDHLAVPNTLIEEQSVTACSPVLVPPSHILIFSENEAFFFFFFKTWFDLRVHTGLQEIYWSIIQSRRLLLADFFTCKTHN